MTLVDIQDKADRLSIENRQGLVTHLLDSFSGAPLGPDDDEVERREQEMDSGQVTPISHDEF